AAHLHPVHLGADPFQGSGQGADPPRRGQLADRPVGGDPHRGRGGGDVAAQGGDAAVRQRGEGGEDAAGGDGAGGPVGGVDGQDRGGGVQVPGHQHGVRLGPHHFADGEVAELGGDRLPAVQGADLQARVAGVRRGGVGGAQQ